MVRTYPRSSMITPVPMPLKTSYWESAALRERRLGSYCFSPWILTTDLQVSSTTSTKGERGARVHRSALSAAEPVDVNAAKDAKTANTGIRVEQICRTRLFRFINFVISFSIKSRALIDCASWEKRRNGSRSYANNFLFFKRIRSSSTIDFPKKNPFARAVLRGANREHGNYRTSREFFFRQSLSKASFFAVR